MFVNGSPADLGGHVTWHLGAKAAGKNLHNYVFSFFRGNLALRIKISVFAFIKGSWKCISIVSSLKSPFWAAQNCWIYPQKQGRKEFFLLSWTLAGRPVWLVPTSALIRWDTWKIFLRRRAEEPNRGQRSEVVVALQWGGGVRTPHTAQNPLLRLETTKNNVIHLYPGLLWSSLLSGMITSRPRHHGKDKKKKIICGRKSAKIWIRPLKPSPPFSVSSRICCFGQFAEGESGNVAGLPVNIQSAFPSPWRWWDEILRTLACISWFQL